MDTTTTRSFASEEFTMANGFYKDCKTAPKLAIRVSSEQRISTTKVLHPSDFNIDGHEFTDLQFRVLPRFKSSDIILVLSYLKQLDVVIHPSFNTFTMGDFTMNCCCESPRISCMIIDSDKMDQIIVKQARNKKNPSDVFLISLHFLRIWHSLRVILERSLTHDSNNSSRSLRM